MNRYSEQHVFQKYVGSQVGTNEIKKILGKKLYLALGMNRIEIYRRNCFTENGFKQIADYFKGEDVSTVLYYEILAIEHTIELINKLNNLPAFKKPEVRLLGTRIDLAAFIPKNDLKIFSIMNYDGEIKEDILDYGYIGVESKLGITSDESLANLKRQIKAATHEFQQVYMYFPKNMQVPTRVLSFARKTKSKILISESTQDDYVYRLKKIINSVSK